MAKRVDHAVLAQHQAVSIFTAAQSRRRRAHLHSCERLDDLWRPQLLLVTVAQLTIHARPKRVNTASTAHHQAVHTAPAAP
eukprot:5527413-Prymnesium_polylepis.2